MLQSLPSSVKNFDIAVYLNCKKFESLNNHSQQKLEYLAINQQPELVILQTADHQEDILACLLLRIATISSVCLACSYLTPGIDSFFDHNSCVNLESKIYLNHCIQKGGFLPIIIDNAVLCIYWTRLLKFQLHFLLHCSYS